MKLIKILEEGSGSIRYEPDFSCKEDGWELESDPAQSKEEGKGNRNRVPGMPGSGGTEKESAGNYAVWRSCVVHAHHIAPDLQQIRNDGSFGQTFLHGQKSKHSKWDGELQGF